MRSRAPLYREAALLLEERGQAPSQIQMDAGITVVLTGSRHIEQDGAADKTFQCVLVDRVAFAEIDRATGSAVEAGIEQARWVIERGAPGEGQLHFVLVGLAGADDPRMQPCRDSRGVRRLAPFHLLDHLRIGLFDECSDPPEHLAAPVTQPCKLSVDQLRIRHYHLRCAGDPNGNRTRVFAVKGEKTTNSMYCPAWATKNGSIDFKALGEEGDT